MRINAMPSVLPLRSTGFAMYPEPPQFGQSSGATLSPPQCWAYFHRDNARTRRLVFCVTKAEQTTADSLLIGFHAGLAAGVHFSGGFSGRAAEKTCTVTEPMLHASLSAILLRGILTIKRPVSAPPLVSSSSKTASVRGRFLPMVHRRRAMLALLRQERCSS